MWAQWVNYSAPTISLQELLEQDGDPDKTNSSSAPYTEKPDIQSTLDSPLIKPITTQPRPTNPNKQPRSINPTNPTNPTTYTPPLKDSTDTPKASPEIVESPFSPFYKFWGHTVLKK